MQSKDCYFIPPNQSIDDIPTDIQHLFICGMRDYKSSKLVFTNKSFSQLTSITIGNYCFENTNKLKIDGLESLESVKIGGKCFGIGEKERYDSVCRITNCPNLHQLEIGDCSFKDFQSFELSNLNSIQSIKFGKECFKYCDFSLEGE